MSERIHVLNPVATARGSADSFRSLAGLSGKAIGFIDNGKPNFNYLVEDLSELMLSRYGVSSIVRHRKRGPSVPAPSDVIADVIEHCDAVVTGSGD